MSQPWMKFYPADWRADPRLRLCSGAARGLWIDLICLMHEAEPCGYLLVNGSIPSTKQVAALTGFTPRETKTLMDELEVNGVFSRTDDDVVFSRRMVRDADRVERDKANGRRGGNPALKGGVNPPDNGGDKAQKPEARSQNRKGRTTQVATDLSEGTSAPDRLAVVVGGRP